MLEFWYVPLILLYVIVCGRATSQIFLQDMTDDGDEPVTLPVFVGAFFIAITVGLIAGPFFLVNKLNENCTLDLSRAARLVYGESNTTKQRRQRTEMQQAKQRIKELEKEVGLHND